jgi:hypothetical protein
MLSLLVRAVLASALLLAACADGEGVSPRDAAPEVASDPCGDRCNSAQLCVQDTEGVYACAMICANQLHCWSGCCLSLEATGYNVCRPTSYCFGP